MKKTLFDNKKFVAFALAVLCYLTFSGCSLNTDNKETSKKMESAVDQYVQTHQFNGNILVAKGGKILFSKSYGYADFDNKTKITPQTRFMIGSITKQFTALAIMQLQEKGLLSVGDTLDKYAPGLPNSGKITIHHLLTHTSGLPRDIELNVVPSSLSEAIEIAKTMEFPTFAEPGKYNMYSNAGYIILGYIIEKVSGVTYKEYLQKNVFDPLGMKNSGFGYDRRNDRMLALGYEGNMHCVTEKPFIDISVSSHASGALYSTVEDLRKWDQGLQKNKIISKKSLDKIFTPDKGDYGYGWFIDTKNDKRVYWHSGIHIGFNSFICRIVDDDICIVALSNVDNFKGSEKALQTTIMDSLSKK